MPLVRVETNTELAPELRLQLARELSRACADILGKPEAYVMSVVSCEATLLFAGQPGPAALVDVRSIGALGPEVNRKLARSLCSILTATAGVPGERTYLGFTDVPGAWWGHDGETFG